MSKSTPSIAIVAGEASGDLQGAMLAARLRERCPAIRISGVGGLRMRDAGVRMLRDSSKWSAIGVVEALRLVPRLFLIQSRLVKELESDPPDLLILIDFGAFNIRLARRLRRTGMKVLYYFPPGSWSRSSTYEKLQGLVDAVVTPFPWSAETLREKGFRAEFFGHPVLDTAKPTLSYEEFLDPLECGSGVCGASALGSKAEAPQTPLPHSKGSIVGLLPGSRVQEIRHNLPAMMLAAARLTESMPSLQFVVPVAPTMDIRVVADGLRAVPWIDVRGGGSASFGGRALPIARAVDALARSEGFPPPQGKVTVHLIRGMAQDVLAYSRAAVVCSGTATLEAAVLGCPMVIIYRASKLSRLEYRLLGRGIEFIGLPNIIANEEICPELIGDEASPARIAQLMHGLIEDSHERGAMLDGLGDVRDALGSPGAVDRTAGMVLEMLGDR